MQSFWQPFPQPWQHNTQWSFFLIGIWTDWSLHMCFLAVQLMASQVKSVTQNYKCAPGWTESTFHSFWQRSLIFCCRQRRSLQKVKTVFLFCTCWNNTSCFKLHVPEGFTPVTWKPHFPFIPLRVLSATMSHQLLQHNILLFSSTCSPLEET